MINILAPRENVNDDTVIIMAINFNSGDSVFKGQSVVEIETSKTNIDIEAPENGVVTHNLELGAEIEVGAILFCIGNEELPSEAPNQHPTNLIDKNIKISKAATRRAEELNIDPYQIGAKWVTAEDVEKKAGLTIRKSSTFQYINHTGDSSEIPLIVTVKREPLSKRKQAEIKNLQMGNHHSTSSTVGMNIKTLGSRVVAPPHIYFKIAFRI